MAAAAFSLSAASSGQPTAAVKAAPTAVVLYVDRGKVLSQSLAAKSLAAQGDALARKLEADIAPEKERLEGDLATFAASAPSSADSAPPTAADVAQRQAKLKELEARREAFQTKVLGRQTAIEAGMAQARTQIEKTLNPILEKIMVEQGANLLVDRGLVVLGATDLDVTATVVQRLNAALPKVAVTPVAAPMKPSAPP
jgi:outer membrane protein